MRIVAPEDILIDVDLPYTSLDELLKEGVGVACHAMQSDEDVIGFCDFVDLFKPADAMVNNMI
jgi:hypothetical protein